MDCRALDQKPADLSQSCMDDTANVNLPTKTDYTESCMDVNHQGEYIQMKTGGIHFPFIVIYDGRTDGFNKIVPMCQMSNTTNTLKFGYH